MSDPQPQPKLVQVTKSHSIDEQGVLRIINREEWDKERGDTTDFPCATLLVRRRYEEEQRRGVDPRPSVA